MRHVLRASSALVLLSGVAAAQFPPMGQPEMMPASPPGYGLVPLNIATSSDVTRSTALQLTRDREMDAVILVNGAPNVVYAPASYGVSYPLPIVETVNDVTSIAGIGLNGLDALIYAAGSGIHAVRENSVEGNYDVIPLATSSNYQGCKLAKTGFDPGSGTNHRVYLLGSDNRTIRSLTIHASSLASGGTVGIGPTIASPRDVLDFTPVLWDTDSVEELALLTTLGVEIYDQSGVKLASFRDADWGGTAVFGDILVRLRIPSLGRDRLAWITKKYTTGADQLLMTIDVTGYELPVDLGTHVVATACAVDDDLDGDDDLFLSLSSSHHVSIMTNAASTPAIVNGGGPKSFSTATGAMSMVLMMPGGTTPYPSNHAWPVAADFAGDGDVDVLVTIPELGSAFLRRNPMIDAWTQVPQLTTSFDWVNESGSTAVPEIPAHANLRPNEGPSDEAMTDLEVTMWHRDNTSTTYDAIACQRSREPLATALTSGIRLDFLDPNFFDDAGYACVMRYVEVDENGDLVRAGPSRVFIIVNTQAAAQLAQSAGMLISSRYEFFEGPPHFGHVTSGGQLPIPQVTPLPPEPPRPGSP